jgi:hypothetical protein
MIERFLDRFGITATALCALNCMLLAILLPVLPILGLEFLHNHTIERIFLAFTILIGLIPMYIGVKRYHNKHYPTYLLLFGGAIYWFKDAFGESLEPLMVLLGAVLVISAHTINFKLCNSRGDCCSS